MQRDIPESLRLLQRSHFAVCAVTGSKSMRIGVVVVVVVVVVVMTCGGVLGTLVSFPFSVPLVDTTGGCGSGTELGTDSCLEEEMALGRVDGL